jgi:uroporphyrinogen-III decarboxylase
MQRRDRLMATLNGKTVDRPPVSFYELNGLDENPADLDLFNIYSHPSWAPLIELTRERTDRIVMRPMVFKGAPADPLAELTIRRTWVEVEGESSEVPNSRQFTHTTIHYAGRSLTALTRRDADVNTVWHLEHLLKNGADLQTYLQLPQAEFGGGGTEVQVDCIPILAVEEAIGDSGIVMIDLADPLCLAAELFDMSNYLVVALTEPGLFHRLVDRFAAIIYPKVEAVAQALPGRLWRIVGPEYASPPFLPPRLFREYVTEYDTPIVRAIQRYGGFARMHSHGRLKGILHHILETGCDGLDPIEPPPQGDMELNDIRERFGEQLVLFGNLEVSDIENLPTPEFEKKVRAALEQGTAGKGRGFVLMPSSCPYGRELSPLTLQNYRKMAEMVEAW